MPGSSSASAREDTLARVAELAPAVRFIRRRLSEPAGGGAATTRCRWPHLVAHLTVPIVPRRFTPCGRVRHPLTKPSLEVRHGNRD
jgi:hypothetical protein